MADFNAVAEEVFEALRSFDYSVLLYDKNSMAIVEPTEARRFVAGRAAGPKNLMVSLVDDDDNSRITLSIGKSTHIGDVMGLNQKLRTLATKYNLVSKTRQHNSDSIDPKEFVRMATVTEDTSRLHVCEGMYGTSRSSYLRLENARMIVRHNNRIDDRKIGARGRHVESIFVENAVGERSLMPTNNLMAGRAMAQHVNQGGGMADPVAAQINGMAMDYGNLGIGAQAAVTERAGAVREACHAKRTELRKTFERLARPTSYAAEAAKLDAKSKVLNETDASITDTRLNELRNLLGEQSKEVYEACCRAMGEAAPFEKKVQECDAEVEEGRTKAVPMTTVLGQSIAVDAWDAFWKKGVLNLTRRPSARAQQAAGSRQTPLNLWDRLAYQLERIADVVQDDGLSNLFYKVGEHMGEETDEGRKKIFRAIAVRALEAVKKTEDPAVALATNNPTVAEHFAWLNQFDPDRLLMEDGFGTLDLLSHDMYPDDSDILPDDGFSMHNLTMHDFDPDAFVQSPEMQDILAGRDSHNPRENEIGKDDIMDALNAYLQHDVTDGFDDAGDMAYNEAAKALQRRGFVVSDIGLEEDFDTADELTIEDVLLPAKNQGADLAGDVTKADITDPNDPEQHGKPDTAYTSRLMTLAGMRMGVPY